MQFRCIDCGELFESAHTNYKFAKGFHPVENPTASLEKAQELDHCANCQMLRNYDPEAARRQDLASASGTMQSGALEVLNNQIASLKAEVEQAKMERATALDLGTQVAALTKELATLRTSPAAAPASAPAGA